MLPRDLIGEVVPRGRTRLYCAVYQLGFSMALVHARRLVERGQVVINGFRCRDPMLPLRPNVAYKIVVLADAENVAEEQAQLEDAEARVEAARNGAFAGPHCALGWVECVG